MKAYKGIKYTLFACCYIFWVASGVLITVGIYAKVAKENDVVDTLAADPALLLLTVGSLMCIITFLGCFGALRDVIILLKMFLGILLVVLILQMAAAVLGFLFSEMVLQRADSLMKKAIVQYREDMDLENIIDFVQKKFMCCGVNYYSDWSQNEYFNCSEKNPSLEACGVPFSCCVRNPNETVFNTMCGFETQRKKEYLIKEHIHINGCLDKIVVWGQQNLLLIGGISISLLCLEAKIMVDNFVVIFMIALAAAQLDQIQKDQQKSKKPSVRPNRT